MAAGDIRLILAAVGCIGLAVWLIVRWRLHPFIGLLCGAFALGLATGLSPADTARAVQKGVGDILGGTGLVVALGLSLGAMLQLSNGAVTLAWASLNLIGRRYAPWGTLLTAMVIGLPLFFETGVVLLCPIIAAAAAVPDGEDSDRTWLRLMLPALAGLSVLHALVPPHPGPLLAVGELHANLGRTILYGVLVAIPTAIVAGPVLATYASKGVKIDRSAFPEPAEGGAPPVALSLFVILLPVVLIAAGAVHELLPPAAAARLSWLAAVSNPVVALLIANLVGLALLFGRRAGEVEVQGMIWQETMKPVGAILLSIGAGGALKQVLVTAGLSDLFARLATAGVLSPIIVAWLVAVAIRLATGSATVATITTAGVMPAVASASGVAPEWIVLAIGAGSVFFSHVNDPGFWLVKGYLGTSTVDTFRTWSLLETVISVTGLIAILIASSLF